VSDAPTVIYLEADDEVTSVVRRVRATEPGPVVVVAPGRSRATSSVVALRLLSRAAEADGRGLRIVGDALTRSLAGEAGLAAYGTLDEARRADAAAPAAEPQVAEIHVVRGPVTDETAPTMAAAAPVRTAADDEMTRPVPVARTRPRAPATPRRRPVISPARRMPLAVFGLLAALLIGGVAAGAALLPAATITFAPRVEEIGPESYTVVLEDPERREGTAEASAEVVATGTYAIQEPATGSVVLFNWTFFPVDVAAGTFVAAGEQAFATQVDVTVPRGRLTGQGTIAAGDVEVAVVAAAPGPAANVAEKAINVVVDQGVDARLRGFPENPQPRVLNPAPTTGGVDTTGPEVTQADIDTAVEALRTDLARQVAEAAAEVGDGITVGAPTEEPAITGLDDLVGRRDQERAEIRGTQAWSVAVADEAEVMERGRQLLESDPLAVPEGHRLMADSVEVVVGEARVEDGALHVDVTATALASVPQTERGIRLLTRGDTLMEAEAALLARGEARVELWPGWVTTVPELDWRVDVRIVSPEEFEP
jgi:hypothetical protein